MFRRSKEPTEEEKVRELVLRELADHEEIFLGQLLYRVEARWGNTRQPEQQVHYCIEHGLVDISPPEEQFQKLYLTQKGRIYLSNLTSNSR